MAWWEECLGEIFNSDQLGPFDRLHAFPLYLICEVNEIKPGKSVFSILLLLKNPECKQCFSGHTTLLIILDYRERKQKLPII